MVKRRMLTDYSQDVIVEVIGFVKKHPALFDKKHRDYANNWLKGEIYKQLNTLLVESGYLLN